MTDIKKSGDAPPYETGYGKPPKRTQFQPGKSGNVKGRPKGARNFATIIAQELNTVVLVTENGKAKKIKKKQIVAKQLVNKAAAGDLKATSLLLAESRMEEQSAAGQHVNTTPLFAPEDKLVLKSILQRIRETSSMPDPLPETSAVPVTPDKPSPQQEQE